MGKRNSDGTTCWLLSEEGILDDRGEPLPDVPFQGTSADTGDGRDGSVAVVVDEHEVWTRTGGRWQKAVSTEIAVHSVAWSKGDRLLVGTEPARVAFMEDGRLAFREGFDALPERDQWTTPWGGPAAVRSLAVAVDGTLYADVHVGWISRSRDGGESWTCLRDGLEKDVHQVAAHPRDPATVFAATADGFHISRDHGDTFHRRTEGLPYLYLRACACFPDRDVYLVSASRGSGGRGAGLYRSQDRGRTWTRVRGLPEDLARNINTRQVAVRPGGEAFAVIGDTALYRSGDYGATWEPRVAGLPTVWTLLAR